MKKHWNRKGFSMAEVLVVIAIIVILAGVGFIALMSHMRNMEKLELDGQAKEIFVAAQNHLAMADSQGYLGKTGFGTEEDAAAKNDVYYYVVGIGEGNTSLASENDILGLMLPFASVDESARTSGSYIIRYQKSTATVMDVFYAKTTGRYRLESGLSTTDYTGKLKEYISDNTKVDLKNYGDTKAVIGYYGGVEAASLKKGDPLNAPGIQLINGDKLLVIVTDNNEYQEGNKLRLTISGSTQASFDLYSTPSRVTKDEGSNTYTITLDDLTVSGMHFSGLTGETGRFVPGEDITVQATAYNNDVLTNIAESAQLKTNSLFASVSNPEGGNTTASIGYLRHFMNLDKYISGMGDTLTVEYAKQTNDLTWNAFLDHTNKSNTQIYDSSNTLSTSKGCFLPVTINNENALKEYDGCSHKITDIVVDCATNAGLFSTLNNCDVKNLTLEDFNIKTTAGNAGALAGTVSGSNITSVLVHNTTLGGAEGTTNTAGGDSDLKIEGSAAVGGLVGSMSGTNTVETSAAAIYVHSTDGAAGGLIGELSSGSVTVDSSYAGGHTEEARYASLVAESGTSPLTRINVLSETSHAGGLVGDAGSASLTLLYSYSTASAASNKADTVGVGGLVGNASTSLTANYCYAAGLVDGNTSGSNKPSISPLIGIGSFAESDCSNVQYMSSVSPLATEPSGYSFVSAVSAGTTGEMMVPADQSNAVPYDRTLALEYKGKYTFATVKQLGGEDVAGITDTHYGDWQVPQSKPLNYLLNNGNVLDLQIEVPEGETQITLAVTGNSSGVTRTLMFKVVPGSDGKKPGSIELQKIGAVDASGNIKWTAAAAGNSYKTLVEARFDATKVSDPLTRYPTAADKTNHTNGVTVYDIHFSLDDITKATGHFANLFSDGGVTISSVAQDLLPGENITVRLCEGDASWSDLKNNCKFYPAAGLAEDAISSDDKDKVDAYSAANSVPGYNYCAKVDNSLFASAINASLSNITNMSYAEIANIRHLQNLDISVSYVNDAHDNDSNKPYVRAVKLVEDITWSENWNSASSARTSVYTGGGTACPAGCFNGIYCPYLETFDGNDNTISGLVMGNAIGNSGSNNAGLFRLVSTDLHIRHLRLSDPSVSADGYAAAVVAQVIKSADVILDTVLAEGGTDYGVVSSGDFAAGGLVGAVTGSSGSAAPTLTIYNSAAALLVKAQGPAGGLVGLQSLGNAYVYASYTGGHTDGGKYYVGDSADAGASGRWNIISTSDAAGGIFGKTAGTKVGIVKTFNTASVHAGDTALAGGIVGNAGAQFAAVSTLQIPNQPDPDDLDTKTYTTVSGGVLDLVYTVAPVYYVKTYGYTPASGETNASIDMSTVSGLSGAVFGSQANAAAAAGLYYLADIFADAKFTEHPTATNIESIGSFVGSGSNSTEAKLASNYAEEGNDAILGRAHEDSLEYLTAPYDSKLISEKKEFPYTIWTTFSFDDVNGDGNKDEDIVAFYGDWQPVKADGSIRITFHFMREDPTSDAAVTPIESFPGSTATYTMAVQLVPFRRAILPIPTVPDIMGYEKGTEENQNIIWTVYRGDYSSATAVGADWTQVMTSDMVGGTIDLPESILAVKRNPDDPNSDYYRDYTLVAHYYDPGTQFLLKLYDVEDLSAGEDADDNYKLLGSVQTFSPAEGENTAGLHAAFASNAVSIPRRNRQGYRLLGWYTAENGGGSQIFKVDDDGVIQPVEGQDITFSKTGTRVVSLYAHYEKVEPVEIKIHFILKDTDLPAGKQETELETVYTLSFDGKEGVEQELPLPGSDKGVQGYKITKTVNGTESEDIKGTDEASFVPKTGDTSKHVSVKIKSHHEDTDDDPYPEKYTVYIDGTAAKEDYVIVHWLLNGTDTGAYSATDAAYKKEYKSDKYPAVTGNDVEDLAALGLPYHLSSITFDPIPEEEWSKYGVSGDATTVDSVEYHVKKVFVITYARDSYLLDYQQVGESVETYYSDYVPVGAPVASGDPEWTGYTFKEWVCTKADGTKIAVPSTMPAYDITMTATWNTTYVPYTVAFWYENSDDVGYTYMGSVVMQPGVYQYDTYKKMTNQTVSAADLKDYRYVEWIDNNHKTNQDTDHFTFDSTNPKNTVDNANVKVKYDGSTILNVYYKRNVYTLTFTEKKVKYNRQTNINVNNMASGTVYYGKLENEVMENGVKVSGYLPIERRIKYTYNHVEYTGAFYQETTSETEGPQYGADGNELTPSVIVYKYTWTPKYLYQVTNSRSTTVNDQYGIADNGEFKPISYGGSSKYYCRPNNTYYTVPNDAAHRLYYESGTSNDHKYGVSNGQVVELTKNGNYWYYNGNYWNQTRYKQMTAEITGNPSSLYYFLNGSMRQISRFNTYTGYYWVCDGKYYSSANSYYNQFEDIVGGKHYTRSTTGIQALSEQPTLYYRNGDAFVEETSEVDEEKQYYYRQTFDGVAAYVELERGEKEVDYYKYDTSITPRYVKTEEPDTTSPVYGYIESEQAIKLLESDGFKAYCGGKVYTKSEFYTRSDANSERETAELRRIEGKYEANIIDVFPMYPADNLMYSWQNVGRNAIYTSGNQTIVVWTLDRMPATRANESTTLTFESYVYTSGNARGKVLSQYTATMDYYLEALPNYPYDVDSRKSGQLRYYKLYKTIGIPNTWGSTYNEDFHPIEGFERNQSWAQPGFSGQTYDVSQDFYYTREWNDLEVYFVKKKQKTEIDQQTGVVFFTGHGVKVPYDYPLDSLDYFAASSDPTRPADLSDDYKWGGWYADPDLTTPFDLSQNMPAGKQRVYGKWARDDVSVTFDLNGGNRPEGATDADYAFSVPFYGSLADKMWNTETGELLGPYNPTRTDGATFAYWYYMKEVEDGEPEEKRLTPTEAMTQKDVKLIAKWWTSTDDIPATVTVKYVDVSTGAEIPIESMPDVPYTKHQYGDDKDKDIVVGDVFQWEVQPLEGYAREVMTTAAFVTDANTELVVRYSSLQWTYTVNYHVVFSNEDYENPGWITGLSPASADKEIVIPKEVSTNSRYVLFGDVKPADETWLENNYRFDYYVLNGDTDHPVYNPYIALQPDENDTAVLDVYLVPDSDAIFIEDIISFYDGAPQNDYKYSDDHDSLPIGAPDGAKVTVHYEYCKVDGTAITNVNTELVHAGTYGVRAYVLVSFGDDNYIVWKSAGTSDDPAPLHLYVRKRFVLLLSASATHPNYPLDSSGVLKREVLFYRIGTGATTEELSELTAWYKFLGLYSDSDGFAEGCGFVGSECAVPIWSADAFRRNEGTSKNTFTYEFRDGTEKTDYDVYVMFGNLTVNN